jgi:hypothetical protein
MQTATDGMPIAWVMGTSTVAGTIVQYSKVREVKVQDSGKGGPVVSHYENRQDFAILVCESCSLRDSTINAIVMVQQDGKIVYDMRTGSKIIPDSLKRSCPDDHGRTLRKGSVQCARMGAEKCTEWASYS